MDELTTITLTAHRWTKSQVLPLKFGSQEIPVYCHMGDFGCGDGGWTLAMKIDGAKVCNSLLYSTGNLNKLRLGNTFLLFFRKHFTMILSFGATEMLITFQEARLALTYKRPSYRPTGIHPSLRSVLV